MTPAPFVVAAPVHWLVPALVGIVVAGAVAIVVVRAAQSRPITGVEAFGFYLRAAQIVALLLILSGAAGILKVGFAQVFGDKFTYPGGAAYWSGYTGSNCSASAGASVSSSITGNIRGVPGPYPTALPAPPANGFGSVHITVTPVPLPPGVLGTVQRKGPGPCVVRNLPPRNLTGQKQSDAIEGAVLLLLGLAIWVACLRFLPRVEPALGTAAATLRRLETLVGVLLFGVIAVGSVAGSLPRAINMWLSVADGRVQAPGAALAIGILAIAPLVYYARRAGADFVGPVPPPAASGVSEPKA
ncbi:MAG TPA: hypothetical protein VNV65_10145 [Candidatus Solibacter sp.]|jgi:hypothetical protein|nr:hypothetical protein [Candidatus Solibacter sp.]